MKRILLISVAILALVAPPAAHAEAKTFNLLLAGGAEPNMVNIWLTPDGRSYVIDSSVPLEVGGTVCVNPGGNPNELICEAPVVTSFEVNSDGGDDSISVAPTVPVPVTLRGGGGNDYLRGGGGPDKLIGGSGDDRLVGAGGNDFLNGGFGVDVLLGGTGDDVLIRSPGSDVLKSGSGNDSIRDEKP